MDLKQEHKKFKAEFKAWLEMRLYRIWYYECGHDFYYPPEDIPEWMIKKIPNFKKWLNRTYDDRFKIGTGRFISFRFNRYKCRIINNSYSLKMVHKNLCSRYC